jgi:uncharacterized protein (TIGR03067 family)
MGANPVVALQTAATVKNQDKQVDQAKSDAADKQKAPGFDATELVGEWSIQSGTRQGNKIESERFPPAVQVSKESFTIPAGPDQSFVIAYKVDAKTNPIAIDFDIKSGPTPDGPSEGHAVGIMKLESGELTLCYDPMGQKRPEKFETTEDNGCFMFVMKKKVTEFDAKKLLGTWNYTSGNKAGEVLPAERMPGDVVVTDKDFTLPAGPSDKFVMSYAIDAKKNPATIDLKIESGPIPPGGTALGLIKLDGDTMTLCYDPTGGKRPEKFEANESNGFFMFELKRAK